MLWIRYHKVSSSWRPILKECVSLYLVLLYSFVDDIKWCFNFWWIPSIYHLAPIDVWIMGIWPMIWHHTNNLTFLFACIGKLGDMTSYEMKNHHHIVHHLNPLESIAWEMAYGGVGFQLQNRASRNILAQYNERYPLNIMI